MKAIRVGFNGHTGARAGGLVNISDRNLRCNSTWQNVRTHEEVHLIVDGDDTKYRDIPGVEILHGEAAIDAAILEVVGEPKPQYTIQHEHLLVEYIQQAKVDIRDLPLDKPEDWAKCLHDKGCVGVRCSTHEIVPCKDVASGLLPKQAGRNR